MSSEHRIAASAHRIVDLEQELAAEMERRDGLIFDARDQDGTPYRTIGRWAGGLRGSTVVAIVARVGAERQARNMVTYRS